MNATRYGMVILRKRAGTRRYAVRQQPGHAPRYCQAATWLLLPMYMRDRIEWVA